MKSFARLIRSSTSSSQQFIHVVTIWITHHFRRNEWEIKTLLKVLSRYGRYRVSINDLVTFGSLIVVSLIVVILIVVSFNVSSFIISQCYMHSKYIGQVTTVASAVVLADGIRQRTVVGGLGGDDPLLPGLRARHAPLR